MTRSAKSTTSKWQRFRQRDKYVREATRLDVRSRSYFKLAELDQRFGLLKSGSLVLDLGASPGGWSQYAQSRTGNEGEVVAVDINHMKPLEGVRFIQLDLAHSTAVEHLGEYLGQRKVEVVLSDMAPNITGNSIVDSRKFFDLYTSIFKICSAVLADSGSLVFKFFQTDETHRLTQHCQSIFQSCRVYKPKPSRASSQESYIIARDYQSHLAARELPIQ